MKWALIVGARGTGKSSLSARVLARLREAGVPVAGVVQEAIDEGGERGGYLARRAGADDAVVVARRGAARAPGEATVCSFVFDPDAFAKARAWLAEDARPGGVVLVDEVSKLEVSGGGHYRAIVDAMSGPALVILAVRADQLFYVMERLGLEEPVAAIETTEAERLDAFVSAVTLAAGAP